MIVVIRDTPSSVEINAMGWHWGPIQDGGCADTSAPIGSVYVYVSYGSTYIMSMSVTIGYLCCSGALMTLSQVTRM